MRRARFPLLVLLAFGVAYGVSWFAVREKYRAPSPPAQAALPDGGAPIARFRRLLEKETNLVRGTTEMATVISQLSEEDCKVLETDLDHASGINSPILHQCAALFAHQAAEKGVMTRREWLFSMPASSPLFNTSLMSSVARGLAFDHRQPAPGKVPMFDLVSPTLRTFGSADSTAQFYSPIHWALTWLGQRDRAGAYSLIRELGPQWQDSAKKWLVEFVWRDGLPEINPFFDRIDAGVRNAIADAIIERWIRFDPSAVFQWALLRQEERVSKVIALASPPGRQAINAFTADFTAQAVRTGGVSYEAGYNEVILQLLDLAPDELTKHLARCPRNRHLAALCAQLCIPVDSETIHEPRTLALLRICMDVGDVEFQHDVEREFLSGWFRIRHKELFRRYQDLVLWMVPCPLPRSLPFTPIRGGPPP